MAHTARCNRNSSIGGRPRRHDVSPVDLLDRFVEYSRDKRRTLGPAAINHAGFAQRLNKTERSVRHYVADYNFPWPLLEPGDLVCLLDDAPPHELLWVSDAWCRFCGHQRDELLWQSSAALRAIGFADGPREDHQALIHRLRAGPERVGHTFGWLTDAAEERHDVSYEFRHSAYASTIYIHARTVELNQHERVDLFNVVPNLVLRPSLGTNLDPVDLEKFLNAVLPRYEYRGEEAVRDFLDNVIDASHPE